MTESLDLRENAKTLFSKINDDVLVGGVRCWWSTLCNSTIYVLFVISFLLFLHPFFLTRYYGKNSSPVSTIGTRCSIIHSRHLRFRGWCVLSTKRSLRSFHVDAMLKRSIGNIPSFSYLEDKAFRHGDIEDIIANLFKAAGGGFLSRGTKFTPLDVKRVYL